MGKHTENPEFQMFFTSDMGKDLGHLVSISGSWVDDRKTYP